MRQVKRNKLQNSEASPDWCGLVGWAWSQKPKGRWFNFWSGHRTGIWARSPAGGMQEAPD